MNTDNIEQLAQAYLHKLCVEITDRSVGSCGNQAANKFVAEILTQLGWHVYVDEFNAMDWEDDGAQLSSKGERFDLLVSPYSLGCHCEGALLPINNLDTLAQADMAGRIVLLHGEITSEQLMPKNFVFFNPQEHKQIISLLERGNPLAVLSATGRNAALAGGMYPFPLIEDGDFLIPTGHMTAEEGQRLLNSQPDSMKLEINSRRVTTKAVNVIARNSNGIRPRIVVSAHIDSKKGSPGALDNASGVVILLLIAHFLQGKQTRLQIELAAFNGEDYFSAPGQMLYLKQLNQDLSDIHLNINIDGAGYREGSSSFSLFGLPDSLGGEFKKILRSHSGMEEGEPWYQGDHSIFIQNGRPAVAVTSKWFLENIEKQEITHTPRDYIGNIDSRKLVSIAHAISEFLITKEDEI